MTRAGRPRQAYRHPRTTLRRDVVTNPPDSHPDTASPGPRRVAVPAALRARARAAANRLRAQIHGQHGYTMIEMLVGMTLTLFIAGATMTLLEAATRAQSRDQSYAQEITSTQTALARLVHDLRQASSFSLVSANVLQFQMVANGTAINVRYDCTASDSLGTAYRRCV